MENVVMNLVAVLNARRASMEDMVQLLAQEKESIISGDTNRLHEVTTLKLEVVANMKVLDGDCRRLMSLEAGRLGLPAKATLTPIINKSAPDEQAELAAIQKAIASLAAEIKQRVDENRRLLGCSLTTINRSLAFFKNQFTVSETYGGSGQMVERGTNTSLLRREI